jgi:hypothetical protein
VVLKHRKRSSRIDQADAELLPRIREIKAAHPFWGYRRVWSYLRYREQIIIGKKVKLRTPIISCPRKSANQCIAEHSFFEALCKLGSTNESITSCLTADRANPYTLKTDL